MSENTQQQKHAPKTPKGLGRGLGSLLGSTGEGAFSKTTPAAEQALETLTAKLPSQSQPAIQEGFVEAAPAPAASAPMVQAPVAPTVPAHMRLWNLPIEKVNPNPSQPRQIFEKEPLQELADSIKEK